MAENDFNIGRDAVLTILVGGQPLGPGLKLTNFEAKQVTTKLTSKPINGANKFREIPEGWEGTCDWDRLSPILDDFFANQEAGHYAGQLPPEIAITQRIQELNGAISRYRFTGCSLKYDDAGTYKSDDKVMQKMSFSASRRLKV
jgi:hypothetical protein